MNINKIEVKDEYKNLVPPLSKEDYNNLKESIKKDGVLYPVIINNEFVLLDGHHRLQICLDEGINNIETIFKTFENPLDEKEFVISSNLNRRHLTTAQKADMGLEILGIEEEKAKQRQIATLPGKGHQGFNVVQNSVPHKEEETGKAVKIAAKKAGISHDTLQRAKKIKEAAKEDPQINKRWEESKQGKTSINSVYRDVQRKAKKEEIKTIPQKELEGKFNVFYVDPPWKYPNESSSLRGMAATHYPTMDIEELKKIPVSNLTLDNSVLFLWTTTSMLRNAFEVIDAWGFKFTTSMVWVKDKIGTGFYVRSKHEIILIATKGSMLPMTTNIPASVVEYPRTKHSTKPPIFYDIIEEMYPGQKYVELFARENREGWESWGNEV